MATEGAVGWLATLEFGGTVAAYLKDVTPDFNADEIDVTTRSSAGWREWLQGMKDWTVEAGALWVPSNATIRAIRDAYMDRSEVAVKVRDENDWGFNGTIIITHLGLPQPLEDGLTMDITMRGTGTPVQVDGSNT